MTYICSSDKINTSDNKPYCWTPRLPQVFSIVLLIMREVIVFSAAIILLPHNKLARGSLNPGKNTKKMPSVYVNYTNVSYFWAFNTLEQCSYHLAINSYPILKEATHL